MPGPNTPVRATTPTLPPVLNLPFVQANGMLSPAGLQFLQILWASIQGQGGIVDLLALSTSSPGTIAGAVETGLEQDVRSSVMLLQGQIAALAAAIGATALSPVTYRETSPSPVQWTPVLAGSVTPGAQTYGVQTGLYAEIGPVSAASFNLTLSAYDAATAGNLTVTGLPSAANDTLAQAGSLGQWDNVGLTALYTSLGVEIAAGTSAISLYQSGSGQPQLALPAAGGSNTLSLTGMITYFR